MRRSPSTTQPGFALEIDGGDGNDKISVVGGWIDDISGGSVDDTITLDGELISGVSGGRGDDTIVLNQTKSTDAIDCYMAEGDGNDTITTNSHIVIHRYSEDGTKSLGMDGAKLEKQDDGSYRLTFAGSTDSIRLISSRMGGGVPQIDGDKIVWG